MSGLGKPNKSRQPILPLTREDIIGEATPGDTSDDLDSVANSLQSSSNVLTSFAERQNRRSRKRKINESFESRFKIPRYFKRLINVRSLDFETSVWDMINLILKPKQVYKSLYYQKETRDKWSRDDPSFVVLLCGLLTISAVCWGIVFSTGFLGVLKLVLYMVVVDFLLFGAIISSIGWFVANKFLLQSGTTSGFRHNNSYSKWLAKFSIPKHSPIEWAYCFDVHCNSYLMVWVLLYLVQFILLPLLRLENFLSSLIGNTLYLVAMVYYLLITFYGYNTLPFLHKTEYLLSPIPVLALFWLIFSLSGFNIANYMCRSYFR
ncbi:hypothetical protein FOA43_000724 [Brettanomyces nanus]|uniref:Uncharacterized protein n=1 Tax=Eeniella nana TaxID=13502 RepID=A0A875S225_EENNA|nr:uncharacterized protein FOA43_000724 [Brettanomyces nanus]QPG73414.1 hypothetical protein FOA43_000724 [Brettanomyces nanus]